MVLSFNGETKVDASHTKVIFLKDPLLGLKHPLVLINFNIRINVLKGSFQNLK